MRRRNRSPLVVTGFPYDEGSWSPRLIRNSMPAAWSLHLVESAGRCQPTHALRKEREMQVEIEYCGM